MSQKQVKLGDRTSQLLFFSNSMSALETLRRLKQTKPTPQEEPSPNRLARLAAFRKARQLSAPPSSSEQETAASPITSPTPQSERECPIHQSHSPIQEALPITVEAELKPAPPTTSTVEFGASPLELVSQLDSLRAEFAEAQRDHELTITQLRQIEGQRYDAIVAEKNQLWMQTEELHKKIVDKEREHNATITQLRNAESDRFTALTAEKQEILSQLDDLRAEFATALRDHEQALIRLRQTEGQRYDGIVSEKHQLLMHLEEVRKQIVDKQDEFDAKVVEMKEAEAAKLRELEAVMKGTFEPEIEKLGVKISELEDSKVELENDLTAKFEAKISELEASKVQSENDLTAKFEANISELEASKVELENDLTAKFEAKISELEANISELEASKVELENDLTAKFEAKISELEASKVELEASKEQSENDLAAKFEVKISEIEASKVELENDLTAKFEAKISELESKISELEVSKVDLENDLTSKFEAKITEKQVEIDELLTRHATEAAELQSKFTNSLETHTSNLRSIFEFQVEALNCKIHDLVTSRTEFEMKLKVENEAKLAEKDAEIENLRENFDTLVLDTKQKLAETYESQISSLNSRINALIASRSELEQTLAEETRLSIEEERKLRYESELKVDLLEQKIRKLRHSALLWRVDYQKATRNEVEKLVSSVETRVSQHQQYLESVRLKEQEETLSAEIRQQERAIAERNAKEEMEKIKRIEEEEKVRIETEEANKIREADQVLSNLKRQTHELWKVLEIPVEERVDFLSQVDHFSKFDPNISTLYARESERLTDLVPLLETITRREFIKYRIKEFNKSASNPDRLFSGDSSRLIREEKHRKEFLRELQRLNEELASGVPVYESKYNRPLLYKGRVVREEVLKDLRSL
ncbi:hypothetical protein RCL1_007454 [Eukaryota sp. TZLM3-RCL]